MEKNWCHCACAVHECAENMRVVRCFIYKNRSREREAEREAEAGEKGSDGEGGSVFVTLSVWSRFVVKTRCVCGWEEGREGIRGRGAL